MAQFWAEGFWAEGFWAEGFWAGIGDVDPPPEPDPVEEGDRRRSAFAGLSSPKPVRRFGGYLKTEA